MNQDMLRDLRNSMKAEPSAELKNRILDGAESGDSMTENIFRCGRLTARPILAAVCVYAVLATTALAAAALPGYIRSMQANDLTVNQYSDGMLPYNLNDPSVFGVYSLNGQSEDDLMHIEDPSQLIKLSSLDEAQAALGTPLLVPSYLERDEKPLIIRKWTTHLGVSVEAYYYDGYPEYNQELNREYTVANSPGFFILAQTYVGDQHVTIDATGDFVEMTVNGYDAVWRAGEPGSEGNGMLYWIHDSCLMQLAPCDLDFEYVMKIAESLVPLNNETFAPPVQLAAEDAEIEYYAKILEAYNTDGRFRVYNKSFIKEYINEYYLSLEDAQEVFGSPLLVPSYLEYNERAHMIKAVENSLLGNMTQAFYYDGYINIGGPDESGCIPEDNVISWSRNSPGFFVLSQTHVGDRQNALAQFFETADWSNNNFIEISVNGYEAVWYEGSPGSEANGSLCWVQDGILIHLGPCDMDFDYVMKIAESLVPLNSLS